MHADGDAAPGALLAVWERSRGPEDGRRLLALLAAASPEAAPEELAALPLGEANRRLLTLRRHLFGGRLAGVARCPACGEELELDLDADRLLAALPAERPPEEIVVHLPAEGDGGALEATLRLPTPADLVAVGGAGDLDAARRALLERCLPRLRRGGEAISPGDLSTGELAALGERLAAADPCIELTLDVACRACGESFPAPLEIVDFVAAEIDLVARRLLRQVHLLARAYGWREADILALPAARRRGYLEMLAS